MTDASTSSAGRPLSDAKREKILSAARRVFLEDGFDGASMQRITALSGVSKATVERDLSKALHACYRLRYVEN